MLNVLGFVLISGQSGEFGCLCACCPELFGTLQPQVSSVGRAVIAAVHVELWAEHSVGSQAKGDEWKQQLLHS